MKVTRDEFGDLNELRTLEQVFLIESYDDRCEKNNPNEGFASNVGTFVRPGIKKPENTIFSASLNVRQYSAKELDLKGLPSSFSPNYIPSGFNSDEYLNAHLYLANHFQKRVGFGLTEFCQISQICSTLLISSFQNSITDFRNKDLFFYLKFQRGYMFYGKTLADLKSSIIEQLAEQRKSGKLAQSNAEQQIDPILDFLTLDDKKQGITSLWSSGPRFVLIPHGTNYICDYSAWLSIFRNLFYGYGLRNYDPDSKKGGEFEYAFGDLARLKSFNVILQSKRIRAKDLEREVDVAIRINDDLFLFECRAFERPLDFQIGKPNTINNRNKDLQEKIDQVTSLVSFIKENKVGDNYDFSWAKSITGMVVSPYTEWIWSRDECYWPNGEIFPRVMSVHEALDYLSAAGAYSTVVDSRT